MSANGRFSKQKDKIINYKIVRKGGLFLSLEVLDLPHKAHKQAIFDTYGVLFNNLGEKLLYLKLCDGGRRGRPIILRTLVRCGRRY